MADKVFNGGMPTAIDVRKLTEAFSTLTVGQEITHEAIEAVLGIARTGRRYATVVKVWRAQTLRNHNIDIGAVVGKGYRVLNDDERVSCGVAGAHRGLRAVGRAVTRATVVNTTNPALLHRQSALVRLQSALRVERETLMHSIEPPAPPKQMPRLAHG